MSWVIFQLCPAEPWWILRLPNCCFPGSTFICQECASGHFQEFGASLFCLPCPAGSQQNNTGSSACNRCPVGQYQDVKGSSLCKACPAHATTALLGSVSVSDCGCQEGFINIADVAQGEMLCVPCGEGLECPFSSSIQTLQSGGWTVDESKPDSFCVCMSNLPNLARARTILFGWAIRSSWKFAWPRSQSFSNLWHISIISIISTWTFRTVLKIKTTTWTWILLSNPRWQGSVRAILLPQQIPCRFSTVDLMHGALEEHQDLKNESWKALHSIQCLNGLTTLALEYLVTFSQFQLSLYVSAGTYARRNMCWQFWGHALRFLPHGKESDWWRMCWLWCRLVRVDSSAASISHGCSAYLLLGEPQSYLVATAMAHRRSAPNFFNLCFLLTLEDIRYISKSIAMPMNEFFRSKQSSKAKSVLKAKSWCKCCAICATAFWSHRSPCSSPKKKMFQIKDVHTLTEPTKPPTTADILDCLRYKEMQINMIHA